MAQTGLESFDRTLHETHVWLKELMEELATDDRHRAYRLLKAVLHALRDRVTPVEAAQFGAQLPMLIRGFYYEGWRPIVVPLSMRTHAEFLDHIDKSVEDIRRHDPDLDVEAATVAVFRVISRHVSSGEVQDILDQLPRDIRRLWPEDALAEAPDRAAQGARG